jgi:two-component system CheB/CheR fusion protein
MKGTGSKGKKNPDPMNDGGKDKFLVVGIGASAGGVGALKTFFENVKPDSGNAYVVILHLSPDYDSQLAKVLQNVSPIPVEQVKDKRTNVKPDHVYVIPPNRGLEITDGHLETVPMPDHTERRAPVDLFFRTLAESRGARAVSVVLTGTGPNGSMGIKRVKEMGGIVVVQDPDEAEYKDMPRNSIATGLVDYVLPVAEIPNKIAEYKERLVGTQALAGNEESRIDESENALAELFVLMRTRTGHDFSSYKRATVLRRIERRMNVHGKKTLAEYLKFLKGDRAEAQALLKDLLISVTNFFRDKPAFEALERDVLPKMFAKRTAKDAVRIWVAGCATGEEAYSFAILCAEQTDDRVDVPAIQIFATDIDEAAIAHARSALYTESDVADVSPERLQHFFQKEGSNYRVRREIRETVLFAVHNVTKDPPFSKLDLVSCRNLLIYLNGKAQNRVMETFHFALRPGGYLFLGSSESAEGDTDLFVAVDKESRIYQGRPVGIRHPVPLPESSPTRLDKQLMLRGTELKSDEGKGFERLSYAALHQRLLELYAPPSVIVNSEHDIVHLSEHAGRYLQIAGGEPSKNVLQVTRPELRLELRTALYQASQRGAPVNVPGLRVKTEEGIETVNLLVRPISQLDDPNRGFVVIIFEPAAEAADKKAEPLIADEPVARRLEQELVHTKSQLRATIEQYEIQHEELKASNEELQAINEELRSAVEEVETSKEELQSVNEELTTVNQELKIKIEELSQSNNDLQNLINSTNVGTIFLDRRLRVKLFTDAATDIFSLIPADLGRPLTDLKSKLKTHDLANDAKVVLRDLSPMEKEVEAEGGQWYMTRVLPYRTSDDRIEGVVLTFLDVSSRVESERELRESHDRLNEMINSIGDAFYAIDEQDNFIFVNKMTEQWTERRHGSLIGKNIWKEFPESVGGQSYKMHTLARKQGRPVHFETEKAFNGRWLDISIYPDRRGGLSCYLRDITQKRFREEETRLQSEKLRLILESATDYAIFTTDENGNVSSWNSGAEKIFGYSEKEIMGRNSEVLFTPEDRRRRDAQREMTTAVKTGKSEDERWHLRKDGSRFFASGVMQPLQADGSRGFVKICRDQTEKLEAEMAMRDRQTLQRLVQTQEDERRRIARDLHDHLGQQLTALRLKIEGLKANYGTEPAIIKALDDAQAQAKKIDDDVSFMTWELRPTALDNLGLRNALGNFVNEWSKNYHIRAEFHTARVRRLRLSPETEINLYRIAQEALNNVLKHAKANKVDVMLEFGKRDLVLMIEDNGRGFDQKAVSNGKKKGGLGLIGMRERATMLGGALEIETARSKGTTIIVRVPVTKGGADGKPSAHVLSPQNPRS